MGFRLCNTLFDRLINCYGTKQFYSYHLKKYFFPKFLEMEIHNHHFDPSIKNDKASNTDQSNQHKWLTVTEQ